MKLQGQKLESLCNVSQGILTGVDRITKRHCEAGLIGEEFINHGVYILTKDEVDKMKLFDFERQIIKPFYKNSDIHKFVSSSRPTRYVIYATRNLDINDFPNIKKHLEQFKTVIRARSEDRGEMQAALRMGKWWVIFAARTLSVFEGAKIICAQRSYKNDFCYNEIPWLGSADVYFITKKNTEIDLKYVLALLNSKLYYLWLYYRGKRKGDMLELFYTPLTQIPIKNVSRSEQLPFINIVDRIIALKQNDYNADTKNYEDEIDRLIYKQYSLSPDEISLIETTYESRL